MKDEEGEEEGGIEKRLGRGECSESEEMDCVECEVMRRLWCCW